MSALRIPYLVGNTFQRDHVQWPTITPAQAALIPGYSRLIGVNLNRIMALAWRVRRWKIEAADISVAANWVNFSNHYHLTASFTMPEITLNMLGTTELALIGSAIYTGHSPLVGSGFSGSINQNVLETSHLTVDSTPPVDVTEAANHLLQVNALLFGTGGAGFEFVTWDAATKLFYPFIACNGLIPSLSDTQIRFGPDAVGGHGTLTIRPGVVPEFDVPMKVTVFVTSPSPPKFATVTAGSADLTMTAIKFWPFSNSLGQPVYDEDSGAQLNDPFA